jgi:heptosyltransferase-1
MKPTNQQPINRILIVKLSAMGDQFFAMAMVNDLKQRWPQATIDWVVESQFEVIPKLCHDIGTVHAIPLKHYAKSWFKLSTWCELWRFIGRMRSQSYDLCIDAQGLMKSAIITRLSGARERVGFHASACGEHMAARLYHRHFIPNPQVHATPRLRALAAFAAHTDPALPLHYNIAAPAPLPASYLPQYKPAVALLLPATSKADKTWLNAHWVHIAQYLNEQGYVCYVSWGSPTEKQNAQRIVDAVPHPNTHLLPATSLALWPSLLAKTQLVVGVDTGLLHLACVMNRPTVGIYINVTPVPWPSPVALSIQRNNLDNATPLPTEVIALIEQLPAVTVVD